MISKELTAPSMSTIDEYLKFHVGNAICSIPYFNNKTTRSRAGLAANIGKGDPTDIQEEIKSVIIKNHIDITLLANDDLRKILVDNNIGIDCSGFAYHVLNAESIATTKKPLNKRLHFSGNILGRIRSKVRPAENASVSVFANNNNSLTINLYDICPGDFISMTDTIEDSIRDHILIIHKVDYDNSIPTTIYYSHSIAYPEDSLYTTGVRQANIKITNIDAPLTQAIWMETNLSIRLQKSKTELRRLR